MLGPRTERERLLVESSYIQGLEEGFRAGNGLAAGGVKVILDQLLKLKLNALQKLPDPPHQD